MSIDLKKLLDNVQTGSYVFTFSGGLRRRCPEVSLGEVLPGLHRVISAISVSGPRGSAEGLKDYFRIADDSLGMQQSAGQHF